MMKHNRFARSSGVYVCRVCKHRTRDAGEGASTGLCAHCFELAGIQNAYADGGLEALVPYAAEARTHLKAIEGRDYGNEFEGLLEALNMLVFEGKI